MSIDFNSVDCQSFSEKDKFGVCENPRLANAPAYID